MGVGFGEGWDHTGVCGWVRRDERVELVVASLFFLRVKLGSKKNTQP